MVVQVIPAEQQQQQQKNRNRSTSITPPSDLQGQWPKPKSFFFFFFQNPKFIVYPFEIRLETIQNFCTTHYWQWFGETITLTSSLWEVKLMQTIGEIIL